MVVMSRLSFYSSFVLLLLQLAVAQTEFANDGGRTNISPSMVILMIVLVSVFFGIGCISVSMRSCIERATGLGGYSRQGNWRNVRQTTARGLDASVIETFPTFRYSTVKTLRIGKEALECPVCLNEFEDDESLRLIPQCCHVFHPGCIEAWLRSQTTCPLCRANLVPVPGESVSLEIPGLARETGQSSLGTPIDDNGKRVLASPDERLIDSVAWTGNQSMPCKSMSTGWKLAGLFSPTSSPGQPEENLDRFTLRFPQEIHDQLVKSSRGNQGSKDHVALPQARSSVRGYRTKSLGTEKNYFYSERFDQDGRLDRRPFSITPPYHTRSIQSPDEIINGSGNYQERPGAPKGLLLAIRSPFDRLFTKKNNVGERSYLRSSDASPA
ncbi:zinc finger family protein [Arabidopsis lyrata subsp. lyrata]|uniref:RING-type E3 ubiquitin transferase n=1 Tax=Arabidopsis lyrata subsp. lyrata TaxID=81972 RepID=D7KLS5_ARALL|nr:E3 ubiquitin-protein ligase ATL15 [Arabidopsis lyrata subsp. lyrata]EFH66777.1 zinc finger family protein [Arabidopsis lyrata subsp. lyrata]|eukprot:XP_020866361.1 E3 ubiquitin-protein ligase ATL15 [Arabidopsis lyrata subsp. lyrata]